MKSASSQLKAMKGMLSKGKVATKGPGKNVPEVGKGRPSKPGKMGKTLGGYYGTKNYDASKWD